MSFLASNVIPQVAYQTVKQAAVQVKLNTQGAISKLASGPVDYDGLRSIYRLLERANDQFNGLKVTPGLAAFAKAQENDNDYNVVAEFTAMQAALTGAMDWMDANVPTNVTVKSPANWGDGTLISNTFSAAQTAGLRTALQAVVDVIS